jgi:hypothetical protein
MITKSKFIKGLWFVEVPDHIVELSKESAYYPSFYIDNDILFGKRAVILYGKKGTLDHEIDLPKEYNYEGLFLTKLATEEDWKELRKLIDIQTEKADKFICESLLYKQEGLDNEKNYLIIREDD